MIGAPAPPSTLLLSVKGGKNTRLTDRPAPGVCATPLAPQVSKYRSLCLRNLLPILRIWLPVQLREVIGGILSISRCDGLGWPAVVGSVGLLFLPDCWAASLVCLFKLAQQGPVGASYLFLPYFLLPFALSGQIQTLIPSASHPRSSPQHTSSYPTTDQYVLALCVAGRRRGHEVTSCRASQVGARSQ